MKKLMIALAAVAVAAGVQAANYNWSQANDGLAAAGTEDYITSGTIAYLFDAGVTTQDALVKAFNGTSVSGYISGANGTATDDGVFGNAELIPYDGVDAGKYIDAYYAIVYDGKLFVSDSIHTLVQSTSTTYLNTFSDPWDDSTMPALDAKEGFKGQGWYSAAAVPEPTSGLLLLLGVAGLALRRRRA